MTSFQLCLSAFLNCLRCRGCDPGAELKRINQSIETERVASIRDNWQVERRREIPAGVRNERIVYARKQLSATQKLDKQLGFALADPEGKKRGRGHPFEVNLPLEAPEKWELERFADAVAQNDGARMTQEDRCLRKKEVVFKFQGEDKTASLYGVFDGHNDDGKAGEYLNRHLGKTIGGILTRLLLHVDSVSDEVIANALTQAFDFLSKAYREERGEYGTTASCAFVYENKIYCPNVGDSRIVLIKNEATYQLTEDATATNDRLLKWNKKAGNIIRGGEVKDPVTKVPSKVTRDIGIEWLCSRPKITRIFIGQEVDVPERRKIYCGEGDFLLLATDGLWKVATVNEVGTYVRKLLRAGFSPEAITTQLATHAGTLGGSDNVTVMIVPL